MDSTADIDALKRDASPHGPGVQLAGAGLQPDEA